jgi:predicted nucleotidyltransferase
MDNLKDNEASKTILFLSKVIHQHFYQKLIGIYVYGSVTGSDFNHVLSDLDILVVIDHEINDDLLPELERIHDKFSRSNPVWKDRLDIAYISKESLSKLKDNPYTAAIKWYEGPFRIEKSQQHWLIDWYKVRNQGAVIYGVRPTAVIQPITKEEFREVIKAYILGWLKNMPNKTEQTDLAYVALTISRSFYSYLKGEDISKEKGARWMARSYPQFKELLLKSIALNRAMAKRKKLKMQKDVTKLVGFVCQIVREE